MESQIINFINHDTAMMASVHQKMMAVTSYIWTTLTPKCGCNRHAFLMTLTKQPTTQSNWLTNK